MHAREDAYASYWDELLLKEYREAAAELLVHECPCLTRRTQNIWIFSHGRFLTVLERMLLQGFGGDLDVVVQYGRRRRSCRPCSREKRRWWYNAAHDYDPFPADELSAEKLELYEAKKPNELRVAAIQARRLAVKDKSMMGKGTSDPVVTFELGSVKAETTVKKKTLNPTWKEAFAKPCSVDEAGDCQLKISVGDWDAVTARDFMGSCTVHKSNFAALIPAYGRIVTSTPSTRRPFDSLVDLRAGRALLTSKGASMNRINRLAGSGVCCHANVGENRFFIFVKITGCRLAREDDIEQCVFFQTAVNDRRNSFRLQKGRNQI